MRSSRCLDVSHTVVAAALIAAAVLAAPTSAGARPRSEQPAVQPAKTAAAAPDPLVVVVSLRRQRLSVFDRNGHVTDSPISSGTSEFPTPTGVFSVIGKSVDHESNIYEGAAMPYMQRLTWTGTAMHAGHLPGYPASHGCIRLPYGFSQRLYEMTGINTRVIVTRDDVAPAFIQHAKLFAPDRDPDAAAPVASTVASRVASLAVVTPAIAAPVTGSNQLPVSAKAKARFAETALLFDQIKAVESQRNAVWETVKAANRAIETAKADVNSLSSVIDDANADADKIKRAKQTAEAQLAAIMRKAQNSRSAEALEALAKAEETAETRLVDLSDKLDAALETVAKLKSGLPAVRDKVQSAEQARRALDDDLKKANQALKDAQLAHGIAKREDARYMKPVSVLVSRKDQRLYVRQGFEPILEVPITIENPDQPLGTHVYTAMAVKDQGASLAWSVVSLGTGDDNPEPRRRGKGAANPEPRAAIAASKALDRIQFPPEALAAITERVKPGSSLIISDESTSQYFGNGTDFTVAVR